MKFHWIDVRGNLFSLWIKWEYFNLKKKPTSEKELALSIYSKMILKFYQASNYLLFTKLYADKMLQ